MKGVRTGIVAALSFSAACTPSAVAAPVRHTAAAKVTPNIMGVWEIYPDPFGGEENTLIELSVPNGGPRLKEPYASTWKARSASRCTRSTPRTTPWTS